ncbi:MAG: ABC transporter ATP-binding protein [Zetaproteobacteria bacterium]|nr:MAG: ABC transporter ATP-binding protein [Zetaproteobacteria bacterium]
MDRTGVDRDRDGDGAAPDRTHPAAGRDGGRGAPVDRAKDAARRRPGGGRLRRDHPQQQAAQPLPAPPTGACGGDGMTRPLLAVEGLRVRLRSGDLWRRRWVEPLHEATFSVPAGTITAFLGANGAGKTTTFRALCGLTPMAAGTIAWNGAPIAPLQLRRHIGFLPELPYFYRDLTGRELLDRLAALSGIAPERAHVAIDRRAEALGIAAVLDQPLRTCSKGEIQRIGLIQAIVHQPELIILDEPMSGLDPVARSLVRRTIRTMRQEGCAVLFSSHILSDAEELCDRVVAIDGGRVIHQGDLEQTLQPSGRWEILLRAEATPVAPPGASVEAHPGNRWMVRGSEERCPLEKALQQLLAGGDGTLLRAEPQRQTLEEAFLHLIRGDEAHHAA